MVKEFIVEGMPGSRFQVEVAASFLRRFLGLMGRKRLPAGHGLLLAPCNSVHMCFMRFSIDVVYIDKAYTVKKVVGHLYPWIGLSMCSGAWAAIELAAGEADRLGIRKGQRLTEWA